MKILPNNLIEIDALRLYMTSSVNAVNALDSLYPEADQTLIPDTPSPIRFHLQNCTNTYKVAVFPYTNQYAYHISINSHVLEKNVMTGRDTPYHYYQVSKQDFYALRNLKEVLVTFPTSFPKHTFPPHTIITCNN